MKRVYIIFLALLKSWVRSRTGIFFSFLFPLMLLLIFGTVFGETGGAKYLLYVQNLDLEDGKPTELSKALIEALNSTRAFDIKSLGADVNIFSYIRENPSFFGYRVLVIPEGFQQKAVNKSIGVRIGVIVDTLIQIEKMYGNYMNETERQNIIREREILSSWKNVTLTGESAEILILTEEGDKAAPIVKGILYSVVNAFNNRLIGATEEAVDLNEQSLATRKLKAVDYYLPGFIATFIMTNGIIGVTSTSAEYRRNGIIKRLATTPLPKSAWILGNVIQQTFLAIILTALMILLAWIIFGVRAVPDAYAIALIIIGSITFCSIGMSLGGVIREVDAATAAGNAIAFPMMFLSGAFWPIEMMPSYLQSIAKILPLYYFHNGLRSIMIQQSPEQALTSFLVLGILAILFTIIAVKVTRWKEL